MEIDFALWEMTALRYFIPLVIEGNRRGITSTFFVGRCGKYNCPSRHQHDLKELAEKYGFLLCLRGIEYIKDRKNPAFIIESAGLDESKITPENKEQKVFVIPYSGDFNDHYPRYKDKVDYILMISKFFADFYGCTSEKNLFMGSPKFDAVLNDDEILKKYDLKAGTKKALIVYPRLRDLVKVNMAEIYSLLRKYNFEIIVKTRGKDPVQSEGHRGDYYFADPSWHPHTTIELMKVSDLVVNFGSGAIKECVMVDTPVIDFHVKPFRRLFEPLYDYKYAVSFIQKCNLPDVEKAILDLSNKDFSEEFKLSRKNHLYDKNYNSSKNILDFIERLDGT